MEIDHLFIFSNHLGKETDDLIDFGFTEGSSRMHPGQGTINRKIYFDNFFLEILWVINKDEIQNEVTSPTKLWERSQFLTNDFSPFGLCLVHSNSTKYLFENSTIYQPDYFPKGMSIDFISNEENPELPCTFRLPSGIDKKVNNEPKKHKNGIQKLTQTEFEIPVHSIKNKFTEHFRGAHDIHFKPSNRKHLTLEFDHHIQNKKKEFSALNLTIKY